MTPHPDAPAPRRPRLYTRRQFGGRMLRWSAAGAALLVAPACNSFADDGDEHGGEDAHWAYAGPEGPEQWGTISEEFATCDTGTEQSPIDLDDASPAADAEVAIHWSSTALEAENNGHTLHVGVEPGSYIEIDGARYELVQFHFHAPSEHTVAGEAMAMETHFVHQAEDGRLAVIGVLHRAGAEHAGLAAVLPALASSEGEGMALPALDPTVFLPEDRGMYRYDGSLTTPPCTEGVRWHLLQEPTSVSQEQLDAYQAVFPVSARPTQPLGSRDLLAIDD